MFLSKLKIIGFKSFPDKTILNFTDGTTSIVGPNGCGKTNIVDAIRWVLGEQKASVLRSNKMEEVIFNGTQKKKPLGFCEVTLTIENNKNLLPIEYDTVEITRRYYRSGESEYYINKTQCRLKDIHDMLIDTGMSSGAYSVIELKMIESILSQNPVDRRSMIDEAAGINNYNKQKASSTRRLISTKSDMNRIFDIMSEVNTNVKRLKLQMKRYDKHKMLSSELNTSNYMYHKKTINDLDERLKPLNISLNEKNKLKKNFEKELSKKEINLERIQKKFEKTRIEMKNIQKQIKEVEELIIKNNQDIIISTEQIGHSKSRIDHFNNEISVKIDQLRIMEVDIKGMNKLIKKLMPEFKNRKEEYDKISSESTKFKKELSQLNSRREDNKSKIQETSTLIISEKNMMDSNNRLIIEKKNLISTLRRDIQLNSKVYDDAKSKLDNYLREFEKYKKIKEKNNLSLIKLNEELLQLQERCRLKVKEHEELNSNIKELTNRIDFYNRTLLSKEGLTSGNKFITNNISKYNGVLGKVSDLISVPNKFMRAISISLGEYSDYIVVDKLDNAMHITSQLSKKSMSFNLVVLDQIEKNKLIITKKHLLSNIKFKPKFENLVCALLGHYILIESFDSKLKKGYSYITLSGDMKSRLGVVKVNPNSYGSGMSVNLEIGNLKKHIKVIKENLLIKVQNKINAIQKEENQINKKIEKKLLEIDRKDSAISDLRINIEQKKFITSENYNQTRSTQVNILNSEKEIVELELKNKSLSISEKMNSKLMKKNEKERKLLLKTIQSLESKVLLIRQDIQKKNINLIEISNEKNSLLNRISDQSQTAEKIKSDIDRYRNEIKKLNDLINKLESSKNKYKDNLKKIHKNQTSINKIKNKLDTGYSSEYQQFQHYQSEIKDKREMKESSADDINKLILNIEKIKSEKEFYVSAINEMDRESVK